MQKQLSWEVAGDTLSDNCMAGILYAIIAIPLIVASHLLNRLMNAVMYQ